MNLGALCGNILTGYSSYKFGRKSTLLAFSCTMLLSHLICFFASTPLELYLARFLVGIGLGAVFTVIPIYIGEVAETETRGFLSCMMPAFLAVGMLFIYAIGPFFSLRVLSSFLIVPIILFQLFFGIFVPESPYFYVAIDKEEEARISLNKLRNRGSCCLKELADIKEIVKATQNNKFSFKQLISSRSFRRGIVITCVLMILQQLIGIIIILAYMETIFIASGSSLSSYMSTLIVAVIQVFVVGLSSYLSDRWGRRFLIALSSGCSIPPLLSLGFYFFLKNAGSDVSSLWWLPVVSLIIFIISYNIGLGPLPWTLLGEMFSSNTKSLASTITASVNVSVSFFVTMVFPKLLEIIGYGGIFCCFATSALVSMLFVCLYVPETKGKRFQDILNILEK
ncbi:hypothetical protein WA026_000471 [Henosepilachna vigintioctopunctata]|uniref:Major facilitator superfamily (MFS) profile domain-containing protein n=1 Tax=Henosepilachna vigintioctopunctata TaxID=420089 RepID=A0AAW1V652_9CUCU